MNGHILAALLVVLGLSVGTESQLVCYEKSNALDLEKPQNCAPGEKCGMFTAYKDVMVMRDYKKKCLPAAQCNSVQDDTIGTMSYKVNVTCCEISLCNDAPPLRMAAWAGLATMMLFIFMFV